MEDEPAIEDVVAAAGMGGCSRRRRTLFVLCLPPLLAPFVPGAEAPAGAIEYLTGGMAVWRLAALEPWRRWWLAVLEPCRRWWLAALEAGGVEPWRRRWLAAWSPGDAGGVEPERRCGGLAAASHSRVATEGNRGAATLCVVVGWRPEGAGGRVD